MLVVGFWLLWTRAFTVSKTCESVHHCLRHQYPLVFAPHARFQEGRDGAHPFVTSPQSLPRGELLSFLSRCKASTSYHHHVLSQKRHCCRRNGRHKSRQTRRPRVVRLVVFSKKSCAQSRSKMDDVSLTKPREDSTFVGSTFCLMKMFKGLFLFFLCFQTQATTLHLKETSHVLVRVC